MNRLFSDVVSYHRGGVGFVTRSLEVKYDPEDKVGFYTIRETFREELLEDSPGRVVVDCSATRSPEALLIRMALDNFDAWSPDDSADGAAAFEEEL